MNWIYIRKGLCFFFNCGKKIHLSAEHSFDPFRNYFYNQGDSTPSSYHLEYQPLASHVQITKPSISTWVLSDSLYQALDLEDCLSYLLGFTQ